MKYTLPFLACLLLLSGCGAARPNQPETTNTGAQSTSNQTAPARIPKPTPTPQPPTDTPEPKIVNSKSGTYTAQIKETKTATELTLTDGRTNETALVAQSTTTPDGKYQKYIPTDVWNFFGPNERYLEYTVVPFEPIPQVLRIYDTDTKSSFQPKITGFINKDKTFWTESGYYILCSTGGGLDGWGPSITATRPPQWDTTHFIYPTEANTTDTKEKEQVMINIGNNIYEDISTCKITNDTLYYTLESGAERQVSISSLDTYLK